MSYIIESFEEKNSFQMITKFVTIFLDIWDEKKGIFGR